MRAYRPERKTADLSTTGRDDRALGYHASRPPLSLGAKPSRYAPARRVACRGGICSSLGSKPMLDRGPCLACPPNQSPNKRGFQVTQKLGRSARLQPC